MCAWPRQRRRQQSGQAVVEYALVLLFVAAGLLLALMLLGANMRVSYRRIGPQVQSGEADVGQVTSEPAGLGGAAVKKSAAGAAGGE